MSINWVMLKSDGSIEPLPNERILHQVPGKVRCDITSKEFTNDPKSFSLTNGSGRAYITNQRVIYLVAQPTSDFKSFSTRILDVKDSRIESTWFSGWVWTAVAKPTSGGGIPADVPLIKIQFTFSEGGHNDFFQTFTLIKERLHHAREMGMDTRGRDVDIEPPPMYSAGRASEHSDALGEQSAAARSAQQTSRQPPPPNEPPPDYEEAQSGLVNVDLEDQSREAAERG